MEILLYITNKFRKQIMKFYYYQKFIPKYDSIPAIRMVLKLEGDNVSIESNGQDITSIVAKKGKQLSYRLLESKTEEETELVLDSFFTILNCGLTNFHYDLSGKPKPIKMVNGKPKEFLTFEQMIEFVSKDDSLSDNLIEQIQEQKQIAEAPEKNEKIKVLGETVESLNVQNKELQEMQESWDDIQEYLVGKKKLESKEQKDDFNKKVDKVSSSKQSDLVAGKTYDFISNIPLTALKVLVKENKTQFKGFAKILKSDEPTWDKVKSDKKLHDILEKL